MVDANLKSEVCIHVDCGTKKRQDCELGPERKTNFAGQNDSLKRPMVMDLSSTPLSCTFLALST